MKKPASIPPTVSVVIPCFNYGKYLREAVESVFDQTFKDFEIIIVNDGSTDNTKDIAEKLKKEFFQFRIRLLNQENSGHPAIARNNGIALAKGEYILPLDADDQIAATMLESCTTVLKNNPNVDFVYTDRHDFDGIDQVVTSRAYDFSLLKYQNYISYCTMFRKRIWENIGGYRATGFEDWDFWIAAGSLGHRGYYLPEPLFKYRRHETGKYQKDLQHQDWFLSQIVLNNPSVYSREEILKAATLLRRHQLITKSFEGYPLISVIVPTFNRPQMLKEALKSILKQTYKNLEIVVVNDAGVDVSKMVDNLQDPRVKYIVHSKNKGLEAARNTGIQNASGQYIALLDDDDLFYPEHLETAVNTLSNEIPVIYTDAVRATYDRCGDSYQLIRKTLPYSIDFSRNKLLAGNLSPVNCFVFEKSLALKAGLFDETLSTLEDWDFWIRLSSLASFKHIAKPTVQVNWRNDGTTMTSLLGSEFKKNRQKIYDKYQAEINQIPNVKEIINEFKKIWAQDWKMELPLASIIILTCNQLQYTRKCIESIFQNTRKPFELIIVDNGSTDGTIDYLESEVLGNHTGVKLRIIKNKENKGFAGGNNQGMATASGSYILLLNNDVAVTPGWLERLIACAEKRPEIGIVGPRSNYVSGPQLVEGVDYDTGTLKGLAEFSKKFADDHAGQAQRVLRVVGFCMLIKRALIDKIGGMDDRYGLGNFEDDDFSLRAAIAGFQSWIARDCFVHHFGHRTFIGEKVDLSKSLHKNWRVFKEKWGLPADKPYGSPYRLSEMKYTRFDPSIHHYPIGNESEATSKSSTDFRSAETLYAAIQAQLNTKPSKEIIEDLQRLVESYPAFAVAYNDLGVLYYSSGNKEKAQQFYEKAVQLDPENVVFKKNLADFYFVEMGRVEEALQIYVKILERDPQDIETLLITGHICVALHQLEDAKVFYRRVLELEPQNEAAQNNLNKLDKINPIAPEIKSPEEMYQEIHPLINSEDPHKAIAALEKMLLSYPEFALAHNDLGVLYYHTGDKEKTWHHYEHAVELMPDNINFQKNLADLYCIELGKVEDALKIYVDILKTNPQDVESLMATGHICKALEKPGDARDFFNRVLEIEPWNLDARKQIEEMERPSLVKGLNSESAEDAYRRLQEKLDTSTPADVIAELEKLIEFYPDFAVGHNDLGVLYYNTGNKEKSLRHYRQAALLQPANITLQKNLADFLFIEQGKVEEALQIYVNILASHPEDIETLLITGHLCVALKKFDDAQDFYERVLALEPGNEDANKNLQALMNRQAERPPAKLDSLKDMTASSAKNEPTDLNTEESEAPGTANKTTASIVIMLDGIQNRVKECLKSIQVNTPEPHELLLVDHGTTKGMLKWAQQFAKDNNDCQIIACARQASWAELFNQAIQKASGELIVVMHNDVVVPEGWLKAFKMCINLESNIGVVGPMSNRAAGIQQLMYPDESERIEFESIAEAFREQNQYRRVPTRKLSDFCMAFCRELPSKIGYFDEQFVSEEVIVEDFCNRAAAGGYQNLIAADTYVFHYDSHKVKKSASIKNSAGGKDRDKYKEKWNGTQSPDVKAFQTVQFIAKADRLSQSDRIDAALEVLLGGIGLQPADARLYLALSEILLGAKRFQDAKDAITEMPPIDDDQEIRKAEQLAYAEEGLGNFETSQTHIEQVLAKNPNRASALNLKGILSYRNNDRDSAEQFFKRAITSDPGYGEPYTNLAILKLEAEQPGVALEFFEKGFILSPADLDIATNYHAFIEELGDFAKPEKIARQAAELYPHNRKIKYMLIDFLIQQGEYEMAMSAIEDAILRFGIDDGILAAALKVREKLGPMTIKKFSKKAPVSLCMIIKDEEKYLARCLASAKPIVDEIIVVDTGSADRSKDIAVTFGARVYDYDWQNDFAAARNFSISRASGEWILILDGDEVISPLDYDQFNQIVTKKPKAPVAYSIVARNYNKLANIVGWVPNEGRYPDEEAAIGWLPSEKVRLFCGKDQIRFEGAVHEMVDPVLKKNGIEIKKCSIPVHHYGRLDKEKLDRKGEIYFDIGQKKLSENGEDMNALRELAIQATILEKNEEAFELWQRLLALNPNSKLAAIAYVNMGTICSRMEKFEDALDAGQKAVACDPDLKEARYNLAMAEMHCGNAPKAIRILEGLLSAFPDYPPAQFILSAAYCCGGQKEKGLDGIRKLKNTPLGAHLHIPCIGLGHSLLAATKVQYAVWVLEAVIECDMVDKEILDLFNECIKMNNKTQKLSEILPTGRTDRQIAKFQNLPQ